MSLELNKVYTISPFKRVVLQASAVVLYAGALVGVVTSILWRSVSFVLGGIYLAYVADMLFVMASQAMLVNADGILLKNRRGQHLLVWSDFGSIAQGSGINRHRVSFTLLSNPPSPGINLGFCRFYLSEGYHLPSTFGMAAKDLANDLEQIRQAHI
jgi:hypothetical protein